MATMFPIADVTLTYSTAGELRGATVTPLLPIDEAALISQLRETCAALAEREVKRAADLAVGAWFARASQVEIADRERYQIASSITDDHVRPDGLRTITIHYHFQERKMS